MHDPNNPNRRLVDGRCLMPTDPNRSLASGQRLMRTLTAALLLSAFATGVSAAPDEELLGKLRGYPVGTRVTWFTDETVRVGSFSNLDRVFDHHVLERAATPSPLPRADAEPALTYRYKGRRHSIDDYLSHQRTTGLMIIKDGRILVERYQYDRTPAHRMLSNSMAKSIVSVAIGIALSERHIRSLDDKAAEYVPELRDLAYGKTSVRDLLRMSSGVRFIENYDGKDDSATFARVHMRHGTIAALKLFNEREARAGTRFHYASIETQVLGLVLHRATGKTLASYVEQKLWQPMGAEADATWITAPDGIERAAGSFSATLRDWGRLGALLAGDGALEGRQIIPRDYLIEATNWHRHPEAFSPAIRGVGYGYQFWTMRGEERRFALLGVFGQAIFIDPALKLVLVHTAAASKARIGGEPMGAELRALWAGLIEHYTQDGDRRASNARNPDARAASSAAADRGSPARDEITRDVRQP